MSNMTTSIYIMHKAEIPWKFHYVDNNGGKAKMDSIKKPDLGTAI